MDKGMVGPMKDIPAESAKVRRATHRTHFRGDLQTRVIKSTRFRGNKVKMPWTAAYYGTFGGTKSV